VSVGGDAGDVQHHGGVFAYDAGTGAELWRFYSRDDLPGGAGDGYADGVFATPAVGDVDNDGDLEIAFGSWDRWFYLLDHQGHKVWEYDNGDTFWSSAAMADVNQDGYLEIITGADISPPAAQGGYLYVFDRAGTVLVQNWVNAAVYSSPAIADLDGDGWLEIVVGANNAANTKNDNGRVYAWRQDGQPLPGWPQNTAGSVAVSSPALADIDNDGLLEVFVGSEDGRVYAWHHDGQAVAGWPSPPFPYFVWSSPTVGDYDGDGNLELIISHGWSVYALDHSGAVETSFNGSYTVVGSPAIGDPDRDGKVEIAIGGSKYDDDVHGYLYLWETGSATGAGFPWPMFQHNAQHTSVSPGLAAFPSSLFVLRQYGAPADSQSALYIRNTGTVPYSWSVGVPQSIAVTPSWGTVLTQSRLTVTISSTDLATGTYELGAIWVGAMLNGTRVVGSPASVPITLSVGQLHTVTLPLVTKSARH
jgi:hypothetical protein